MAHKGLGAQPQHGARPVCGIALGGAPVFQLRLQPPNRSQPVDRRRHQRWLASDPTRSPFSGALRGIVSGAATGAGAGMIAGTQRASAAKLLRMGKPGRASIVQSFPIGMRLEDGDQLLGFVLDVIPSDGGSSFRAMVAHRVPDSAMVRAVPGVSVPVSYDPADPMRKVAIDWSAS